MSSSSSAALIDSRRAPRPEVPPPARRSVDTPGRRTSTRHDLVGRLLDGTCRLAELPRLAALLGVPVGGTFVVVVVRGGTARDRVAARACVTAPVRWHTAPGGDHGLVLLDPRRCAVRPGALPAGVRIGVGLGADGLAGVPQDRRRADLAADLVPVGGGLARLDDHLVPALVASDRELAEMLAERVLDPVLADPDVGTVLLATLAAWLEADGSTRDAAAALGCHRNTVTNRLRRVERLTGRRVDRPRDLVVLALAVAGVALRRATTGVAPARSQRGAPPGRARRAGS